MRSVWVLFVVVGCGGGTSDSTPGAIGPNGGTVEVEGARLDVPPGALDQSVQITLQAVTGVVLPSEATAAGPVFQLGPDDVVLKSPAILTLAFDPNLKPDGSDGTVGIYTEPTGGGPGTSSRCRAAWSTPPTWRRRSTTSPCGSRSSPPACPSSAA